MIDYQSPSTSKRKCRRKVQKKKCRIVNVSYNSTSHTQKKKTKKKKNITKNKGKDQLAKKLKVNRLAHAGIG